MQNIVTAAEAATIAGCNSSTLRYAILRGKLKAVKLGKTWLIDRADLDEWMATPDAHKPGVKPKR